MVPRQPAGVARVAANLPGFAELGLVADELQAVFVVVVVIAADLGAVGPCALCCFVDIHDKIHINCCLDPATRTPTARQLQHETLKGVSTKYARILCSSRACPGCIANTQEQTRSNHTEISEQSRTITSTPPTNSFDEKVIAISFTVAFLFSPGLPRTDEGG